MPSSLKEHRTTPCARADTQVTPVEREKLKSIHLDRGIPFFDGRCLIRVANTLELRQSAYELLHSIYSKMGFVKNTAGGLWLSIFDALPETTTLVAEDKQGNIGAALTLVFDSPIGLPADELFKEEIDGIRHSERRICEIISFGIDQKVRGSVKILAGLFYCAYALSRHAKNATDFVITVHARYENFYSNLLFNKIGPVREYAKVNGAPTILLNLPLQLPDALKDKQRIFPLSMLNYSEQKELEVVDQIKNRLCPMSDEEFFLFFIKKTDTWEKACAKQKNYINKIYSTNITCDFR